MISSEIKRAIKDYKTLGLLGVEIVIVVTFFLQYTYDFAFRNRLLLEYDFPMICPTTVYEGWIGCGTFSLQSFLYYMILPLIVAGSYADSLYTERKSGYLKNILLRVDVDQYIRSKLIAVFVESGMLFTLPLLLSFLMAAAVLPNHLPQLTCAGTLIRGTSLFGELYYAHPLVYTCIWLLMDFVYAGLIGCVSMLYSFFVEHRFYIYAVPFITWMFMNSIFGIANQEGCSPIYFLNPGYGKANGIAILAYAGVFVLVIAMEWAISKRYELR